MSFLSSIFLPRRLTFGADIKSIRFTPTDVVKAFKTRAAFEKTVHFYTYVTREYQHLFPKLHQVDAKELTIETENCGELVNLYTLPGDYTHQLNTLRAFFLSAGILVLDIRFMPWTPYVLNNVCVKEGRLTLVDLALYRQKTPAYINKYFDKLIWQIRVYTALRHAVFLLYPVHIFMYILWLLTDLFERITGANGSPPV